MNLPCKILLAASALALLTGCSSVNNLLGKNDNTVLPGQREDAIPGRTKFPEKQDTAVGTAGGTSTAASSETYCAPDDPACKPPGSSGDTFKDPQ